MYTKKENLYNLKIQKTSYNTYNVMQTFTRFKSNKPLSTFKHYDKKLDNSISRARTNIFNIVYYNKFTYFYTQTVNSVFDRTDLKLLINKFSSITRYCRKKYPNGVFYYCIIPEYHLDNKSWHLHGFLSKDYDLLSYKNKNGFKSLSLFDKIGFNSIDKIKNYEACLKYSGAYVTKELAKDRNLNDKLYFCSQNLNRSNIVNFGEITQIAPIHYDFKSEFVFKTTINEDEYYNFVTKLDKQEGFTYNQII